MDVFFVEGQRIVGRLFYPEYEEYHDEIGPAHIFAMSIRGEGFRARQCFREGLVSLRDYDEIFEQACAEESAETLCRLAGSRLAYPVDLEEIPEQRYREYLQEHQEVLAAVLVEEQEIETLRQFAAGNILFRGRITDGSVNGIPEGVGAGNRGNLETSKTKASGNTENRKVYI